jgi:MFS family permease
VDAAIPDALPPWPASRVAWLAMVVFALTRVSAQLDLTIMSLLVEPIKHDLRLSDGQLGLILGFAFASFQVLIGVPLSRLVDHHSRKLILVVGISVWSFATAFTGLARTFAQLFLCRVCVGAGESVNGPSVFSMISDFFPRAKLPLAIAVMSMGTVVGSGVSLVLGALVIQALTHLPPVVLPLLGEMRGWQLVFVFVGLPGLLVAWAVASTPEPPRRRLGVPASSRTIADTVRQLCRQWRLFAPMFAGVAITGMVGSGSAMWRPAFFHRTYGWSPQEVGMTVGIASLIAAPLGLLAGAWLSERLVRRCDDANLRVVAISWITATPFVIGESLMPSGPLAVACGALALFCTMMGVPTLNAAVQSVTPSDMRGQITALFLMTYTLVGQGLGPSVVAAVTTGIVGHESGLRYALAGIGAVAMSLAVLIMLLGIGPYGREIARIRALEARADTTES